MADERITRRDFLQTSASAAAAGGLAMGIGALGPKAAGREMWANLPQNYHWLRDWEYV